MIDFDILSDSSDEGRNAGRGRTPPFRHLALIGNALPRKCGLATYTNHVCDALNALYSSMRVDHYAMDDGSGVIYPPSVITIDEEEPHSYRAAAKNIEATGTDAIWLQHEYGIFGGAAGSHILELLAATDLPLILTLHTVLEHPSHEQEVVLKRLIARADVAITMSSTGAEILKRRYEVSANRLRVIPHGVPDRPLRAPDVLKPKFGWQGRKVLMTFGLLAPSKGIRHMIEAMPAIVRAHPNVFYEVVGATHPNLVRKEGEEHRRSLMNLARELGVGEHVQFVDRFVEQEELLDMLQAADIYVTPYLNMAQATSGTLSYAVAAGKPVVSTPYVHAREILADGHGVLVAPSDAGSLASAVLDLLDDHEKRRTLGRAAYERGRTMLWPHVVEQSLAGIPPRPRLVASHGTVPRPARLPLDAIERMSDAVGIHQHAIFSLPNRDHGYCIDDNARALMAMVRRGDDPRGAALASTFAAFVQHGWNPTRRRFRNFMGFDRSWLEECGSEDSNGRTVWALGFTAARSPWPRLREWAQVLFQEAAPIAGEMVSPRARAFAALGGCELLGSDEDDQLGQWLIEQACEQLMQLHGQYSREEWNWFEPWLAYDNARLPEVLIRAGQILARPAFVELGLSTLGWLGRHQSSPRGVFRPVGCKSFGRRYAAPLAFDQQPLEATATIDAAAAAYAATGNEQWRQMAHDAFNWFFGANDAGVPIANAADGSCCDGLMATGINRNQGAESILSLHLAAQTLREAFSDRKLSGQERPSDAEARTFAAS
ncbi:MAG TPA: glycosyltransferase family 4 protein [Sphingomicrobium sp.]|nr:glycosyltransferase family 4 protein [Sphingomicrobium sp.]